MSHGKIRDNHAKMEIRQRPRQVWKPAIWVRIPERRYDLGCTMSRGPDRLMRKGHEQEKKNLCKRKSPKKKKN